MPTKAKAKTSKGLSVKTFHGLNKKRIEKKSYGGGFRLNIKQGDTVPVQFLDKPDDFTEFDQHSWKEDGRWQFVPCAGDDCPLCADEDDARRKTGYRFACNVYDLKDRKVKILEGPKDLAGRIFYRYERAPAKFLKRTYDITKFPTTPVSYDFQVGEDDLVAASVLSKKAIDIGEYFDGELKRFYGDDMPTRSALDEDEPASGSDVDDDEDDDDEEEEESYTLSDLKKMKIGKLREIAETLDIDVDDLDKSGLIDAIVEEQGDEGEDDEEDEEEEDDDDEEEADETEAYTLPDLKKMKVAQLQEVAEEMEIDTEGMDKSELIEAIMEEQGDSDDEDDDEDDEDEEDEPVKKPAKKAASAAKTPRRR